MMDRTNDNGTDLRTVSFHGVSARKWQKRLTGLKHNVALRPAWSDDWHTCRTCSLFLLHTLSSLSPSLMHSPTNVVSIMAGCCLYNDPIFPDWRGAICFVCHTKRRETVWVQADHPTTHTHTHTNTNTRRTLLSWRPPIDFLCQQTLWLTGGRALALYLSDKSSASVVNFSQTQHITSEMMSCGATRRIFDFNTLYLFSIFLSTPLLCFSACLWLILWKTQ